MIKKDQNKKVIVAIDFGTSGTTFAYAFLDSQDSKKINENVITANWNIPEAKNSTEIILNENLELKKFGSECETFIGNQSSSNKTFYHFKDIKMKLYDDQTTINDNNNKITLPLSTVISKILIKIKEIAINKIKSNKPSIKESDIKWKVTVPAIWKNKNKEIMIKASRIAQIIDENESTSFFFCLEPEAAACNYVFDSNADKDAIKPGNIYIVCDIGGGTVDISTHKRIKNGDHIYIEEMYPPIGGNNGSTKINKLFLEKVISKIFGSEIMGKLYNIIKNPHIDTGTYDDYCEFLKSIEKFKIDISYEDKDEAKRINCSLFEKIVNNDIEYLIKRYNNNCPQGWQITLDKNFKIFFPYKIMIDLTKEVIVDKVVGYLKKIMNAVPDIKSIIYAGSVSTNELIISLIKEQLPFYIKHYVSSYPSTSVVTGAVLFGFNPYIIESRKSRYFLGICVSNNWDDSKYGHRTDKKFFDKEYNCYRCKDCFSPIIKMNETVKAGKSIIEHYEILCPKTSIKFYKTIYDNVIFVDEKYMNNPKCLKFGELIFDVGNTFDKNQRDLIIELKLGGTYIDATIKYKDIIKEIPFNFNQEE